jgi:hypothetical protein
MFNQVVDNFRQATESTVQLQQEMFRKWITLWPTVPVTAPSWPDQVQQFQKKWAEVVGDIAKRQREMTETTFKAGLQNIDKAFQVGEAKTPEEFRARTQELWQKCFDNLGQVYEAQLRGFEMAMAKWSEMVTKTAA